MDKKVEKFQADYAKIKAQVKLIKQKLCDLKKEVKPVAKAAYRVYERGDKTMYDEGKGRIITPKFDGLPEIMQDLDYWMELDGEIDYVIENTL